MRPPPKNISLTSVQTSWIITDYDISRFFGFGCREFMAIGSRPSAAGRQPVMSWWRFIGVTKEISNIRSQTYWSQWGGEGEEGKSCRNVFRETVNFSPRCRAVPTACRSVGCQEAAVDHLFRDFPCITCWSWLCWQYMKSVQGHRSGHSTAGIVFFKLS